MLEQIEETPPVSSTVHAGSRPSTAWICSVGKSAMDTLKGEGTLYKNFLARQATSQTSFATGRQSSHANDNSVFGYSSYPNVDNTNPFGPEWLLTVQSRAQSSGRRMGSALGVGLVSIGLLPLGPIIMLIGGACGLVVGFICGVIFDWVNTKRTISLADKELKRLTYLVRFAMDEINRRLFTRSDAHGNAYCCHLLESVIMEFKPYVQVGRLSGSAIKKLKLLYSFLRHRAVHQCLWIYVNDFLAKWATNLTVSEFSRICRDVLITLIEVEKTLSIPEEDRLEVIGKVQEFLSDPKVRRLNISQSARPDEAAIKHLEAVLVRDFYMHDSEILPGRRRKSSIDRLFTRRNSDLLRDPTDTEFGEDYQDVLDEDEEATGMPNSPMAPHRPSTSLFKSFRDFMNFDLTLKHKIPISTSEFRFLYEKELEPLDSPGWELAADRKLIKILKYTPPEGSECSSEGTSVLVRAYATIPDVTVENVFFNIFNPQRRQTWDTNFANIELLPENEECEVLYCVLQSPFGVTPRDFLQYRKAARNGDDCLTILMRSAEHERKPVVPGYIRAESHISGYVIRKTPTGASLFIMSQTDVKGLIPKWIVNMMAAKAPAQWVNNLMRSCGSGEQNEASLKQYAAAQTGTLSIA